MPTHHLEIEDKYDVADDTELPALDDWPGVVSVDSERFELEATYFDTADLRAARSRITVRRRTGGGDAGWHVKLPVGPDGEGGRHEVRLPLGRNVHTVPKALRDLLLATLRDETLTPVAVLRTDRTVHRLRGADGVVLAELADDRVRAGNSRDGTLRDWREWEVELVEGDDRLLRTARKRLTRAGAEPSASGSKLARALGDHLPDRPAPPRLRRKGPAADVVRARLAEQVAEVLRRDPGVRTAGESGESGADSVHRMRVAVRRLRTALATFRPLLDRSVTDDLRAELAWLGDTLGAARDAQVQRRYLARRLDRLDDELPGFTEAWAAVGAGTDGWAGQARRDLLVALDSERYLALLGRLDALVADPPLTAAAQRPVRAVLTKRVRREWSRTVGKVRAVDEVDDADHDAALHEARKAVKRLRYAVEALQEVYGDDARRLVTRLKRVQDRLGDQHDAVFAQGWLLATARDLPADQAPAGFALGVLHERLGTVKDHEEARFEEAWHAAARPALRAWLG